MKKNVNSRTVVAKGMDVKVRSFSAYLQVAKMQFSAANLDRMNELAKAAEKAAKEAAKVAKSVKTEEAKQAAKVAAIEAERMSKVAIEAERFAGMFPREAEAAKDITDRTGLKIEDFNLSFLKDYIPTAFNSNGRLCDIRKVKPEDEDAARKDENRDIFEVDGVTVERVPVVLWTGSKLLQKFAAAAKERRERAKYASQLEREQAKANRRKAIEDSILAKAAAIQAARAQEAKDSEILDAAKEAANEEATK